MPQPQVVIVPTAVLPAEKRKKKKAVKAEQPQHSSFFSTVDPVNYLVSGGGRALDNRQFCNLNTMQVAAACGSSCVMPPAGGGLGALVSQLHLSGGSLRLLQGLRMANSMLAQEVLNMHIFKEEVRGLWGREPRGVAAFPRNRFSSARRGAQLAAVWLSLPQQHRQSRRRV